MTFRNSLRDERDPERVPYRRDRVFHADWDQFRSWVLKIGCAILLTDPTLLWISQPNR